eukprot:3984107-Pyramimonas_sp.AAC.1
MQSRRAEGEAECPPGAAACRLHARRLGPRQQGHRWRQLQIHGRPHGVPERPVCPGPQAAASAEPEVRRAGEVVAVQEEQGAWLAAAAKSSAR